MKQDEVNHAGLDEKVSGYLENISLGVSRRGIITRLSKLMLGMVGVTLVPGLPVDREVPVSAQGSCSDWRFCGMCGYFCTGSASCCPAGTHGDTYNCPSCTSRSTMSWSGCCTDDPAACVGTTVFYYDCCGGSSADAASCMGSSCCNHDEYTLPTAPAWCTPYRCTVIALGGECSL